MLVVAITKGQPLAQILNIDDLDNNNGSKLLNAPCDLIPILHFPSASVLSGTQLYKVFICIFISVAVCVLKEHTGLNVNLSKFWVQFIGEKCKGTWGRNSCSIRWLIVP